MKYRRFGSLDWDVSILGLGVARLPLREDASAPCREAAAIELIRCALDKGVNYLDLGYPFDLRRQEHIANVVGEALRDGYRKKTRIAVTLPAPLIRSARDLEACLNQQLAWLRISRTDFCLIGRLHRENWASLRESGALHWMDVALKENRFSYTGFSFHDHFQILRSILDAYDRWDLCHFEFSYMDIDHDPGLSGIQYASRRGLAAVVTEPLRSGRLTSKPPEPVSQIWSNAFQKRSPADWALRFVWNYPEVATAVLSMSSMQEVAEGALLADSMEPDCLSIQEEVLISRVRDAYRALAQIPCASCRPCMPCPEGIDVPRIFEIYNDAFIHDDLETARWIYKNEQHHAEYCTACRLCEDRCVKRISIIDWLDQANNLLSGGREK